MDYPLDGEPVKTDDNWCFKCDRPLDECECPELVRVVCSNGIIMSSKDDDYFGIKE